MNIRPINQLHCVCLYMNNCNAAQNISQQNHTYTQHNNDNNMKCG